MKFKVAHLCGLTRNNEKRFRECELELTKKGYICFAPVIYDLDVYNQYKDMIDDMCYFKLLNCDMLVVVTPEHIGKQTKDRIKQAQGLNIPVYLWINKELVPYIETTIDIIKDPSTSPSTI